MKRAALIPLLALLTTSAAWTQIDTSAAMSAAMSAALKWLQVVDAKNYAESLQMSGSVFRNQLTTEQWTQAASTARSSLGKVKERRFSSANEAKNLPKAPPGDYVVMQTQAKFEQRSAIETITVVLEDGQWRVVGYFIK